MYKTVPRRTYIKDKIRLQWNRKTGEEATVDVKRGCVGCELRSVCYAAKMARMTNIDFFKPVEREWSPRLFRRQLDKYTGDWIRVGCISDPSLNWGITRSVCEEIINAGKTPVVVTKNHRPMDAWQSNFFRTIKPMVLQISVSGLMGPAQKRHRLAFLKFFKEYDQNIVMRLNSAVFKTPKAKALQQELIEIANHENVPILETPIRLFKTSPIWKLVDQSKYHRHRSPISGNLDNQRCAGLIIKGAYPCYSSCSPVPTKYDPIGCPHACVTRVSKVATVPQLAEDPPQTRDSAGSNPAGGTKS